MNLTQTRLKELLHYDPDIGIWTWIKVNKHNKEHDGKPAGNRRADGYLRIRIGGHLFYASRLACLYMTGKFPEEEMDHEDRDPGNDKWTNLREATSSQNKFNRGMNGLRGVYCTGSKWWAMVGRSNYLGTFDTLEQAIIARDTEALKCGGDFALLNQLMETSL